MNVIYLSVGEGRERRRKEQARERRLIVQHHESAMSPHGEAGCDVPRLIHGKRLGSDEPAALRRIDQKEPGRNKPAPPRHSQGGYSSGSRFGDGLAQSHGHSLQGGWKRAFAGDVPVRRITLLGIATTIWDV